MPKKIPLIAITVHRDGKPVVPPVGKPFDFTEDEIAEVNGMVAGAMRDPVNESPVAAPAPAAPAATGTKAKAKAGDDGL